MPEKVSIREDLQVIQVDSYGDVTAEDLTESLDTVIRVNKERGLSKVFVDATQETSHPNTLPVFEFGSELARSTRGMKIAILHTSQQVDNLRFLESFAMSRGARIKLFSTSENALGWLTSKGVFSAEDAAKDYSVV